MNYIEDVTGGFTIPGEAGYEELTLKLAKKWDADAVRDSDGTDLSKEIQDAGMDVYSTICIIRDHNKWATKNMDKLQQTFLMSNMELAKDTILEIDPLLKYSREQFAINELEESIQLWQVFDRTTEEELSREKWYYDKTRKKVIINNPQKWHNYTVNFLAYRIWEEISMYNYKTNNWTGEHLLPIDPVYVETQMYMLEWMDNWCKNHPATNIVRFTSLFYNFVWIWGNQDQTLYSDWASYDFTVSPLALKNFEKKFGYKLTSEDFINQGKLHTTHMPGNKKKSDWMKFISSFVISFAKKLVEIVHSYGKKAYVFYDDSWIGLEPYNGEFKKFGFDALIKCVFSGFEVRLCAGVDVPVHELRLHPYLFPVGLGGVPTFEEGGNPTKDAKEYWKSVRRALLIQPIERIGLGGYLHLTEKFPEFCDYIEEITHEFKTIRKLHLEGKPQFYTPKVAILHYWGRLRSWTLSGHFHETYRHDLIHVIEALSGFPLEIEFIDFNDIKNEDLSHFQIIINAGQKGDAWSGGTSWNDEDVLGKIRSWVDAGGIFVGIGEPSATDGYTTCFRLADVLGVDKDTGERVTHGKRAFKVVESELNIPDNCSILSKEDLYLTDANVEVLLADDAHNLLLTKHRYGMGYGIYMSGFQNTPYNARMLLNVIMLEDKEIIDRRFLTDNVNIESVYFPNSKSLVLINNTAEEQQDIIVDTAIKLKPYEMRRMYLETDGSFRE